MYVGLKIHYVIAIHRMRWQTNLYDFRFKGTATTAIGIHRTKTWLSQLVNYKNAIWTWGHFHHHHHDHHHHVVLVARISLTLSCHFSLSFITSGWSSGLNPVSSHSCWMYVRAGRPAFTRPYVGGSIRVYHLWVRPCFFRSVLHVWFV